MAARKSKKWATNPFLPALLKESETKIQKVTSPLKDDDLLLVSRTTGELPANANVGLIFTRKVEANEFLKVYVNGIAALFGGPMLKPWMLLAVTIVAAVLVIHNTWKLKKMKLTGRRNDSFPEQNSYNVRMKW